MSETPSARKDAAGGDDALALFACPNPECDAFNRFGAGNLSVCERIGKDRHIRRLYCSHCQQRFSERQGSLMQETKLPEPAVVRIIKCLGHGCSVEATADICSVDPRTALDQAVDTLRSQLAVFNGDAIEAGEEKAPVITIPTAKPAEEPVLRPDQVVLSLESLDLSSRVLHSLQEEGIDSVNALLALSERDLKKVGGVGEKSLEEIKEQLAGRGLKLKE